MFSTADTIVAIATPPGKGGIGVVRLSGPHAPDIASQLIDRPTPLEPRHATFTSVRMARETVDQVVATYFPAPHSYTGDDVVEISGHGSPVLLERIVALAIATGARLAEPGEFTLRAFLNGRIDLVQAEAVADVIDAVTPQQARVALDQLDGTLTSVIRRADLALLDLIAKCEASLDFPDEGFHFIEQDEARDLLERVASDLRSLLASAAHGRLLREGRTVALAGRPNTGKSSLFNALLGRNRAIVTNLPGTTRDLLTERVDMLGVPVTLIDTAGVRVSDDPIEQEGVSRAAAARAGAAMTLVVLDLSTPLTSTDRSLIEETEAEPRLVVANKCDQPAAWSFDSQFPQLAIRRVSAESGEGLDELRRAIAGDVVQRDEHRDTPTLTNLRHVTLAQSALDAVVRASTAMQAGATEELVLIDLHDARERLEEITGRRTADDVLAHIFAKFCVGK